MQNNLNDDIIVSLNRQVYLLEQKCARMQEALEAVYVALDNSKGQDSWGTIPFKYLKEVSNKVFQENKDA